MRVPRLVVLILLTANLAMVAAIPVQAGPPQPTPGTPDRDTDRSPLNREEVVLASAAGLAPTPVGDVIEIAGTTSYEEDPAVAFCAADQYLVVYIIDGVVYGQRLTSAGGLLGDRFVIYPGGHAASRPEVACEWTHNRFIVVWASDYYNQGTDHDIYAQGVTGAHQSAGSQLHGSLLWVSATTHDEREPAVACNSDDSTCLIVFEYLFAGDDNDIHGQRIDVTASDISEDGDPFVIAAQASDEHQPAISWGSGNDNFMVVWTEVYPAPSDHLRVVYARVYDTEQGTDDLDEIAQWPTFLVSPGTLDHDQTMPDVAYSRDQREYLVVFSYAWEGTTDLDVHAHRVGESGTKVGPLLSLATFTSRDLLPVVAFSGGPEGHAGGMGLNEYLVPHISDDGSSGDILYGTAVEGDSTSVDQYADRVEIDHIPPNLFWYIGSPDVTGSFTNGRYLVVWQYSASGSTSGFDVRGQILTPFTMAYLPLVLHGFP